MSSFAATLQSLKGLSSLALDLHKHVPVQSEMRAAARKIADLFEMPMRPGEEELLLAFQAFTAWFAGGREPARDDWMLAPWICLQGTPRLLDWELFATGLNQRLTAERQPRLLKAIVHSYLRDWEPEETATTNAGRIIERELLRHDAAWAVRWRERAHTVALFNAEGLPSRLVNAALDREGDVRLLLRDLGFTTELLAQSGVHAPLARELAVRLSQELSTDTRLAGSTVGNILGFLRTGTTLRFPEERVELAELLLAPFATKDLANGEAKVALVSFFDELYGDPRSHPKSWADISHDARRTITRWLARKALELFFDILSATADPIWRWRKAFWLALERRGVIDDAWPIFGRQAADWLADHPEQRRRVAAHARLIGAERKQSVMLMRIGSYIVAEWSHAGSVRVWAHDDVRAPSIGELDYYADEVRADCLYDQRHDGTASYAWQSELSDWLATRIGVRIGVNEMRPNV
ncbi:EH signature domain-containing protein [Sphingobium yanoikuyae]|uniref:Zorya protein ZorC EH domain-containing protein n=1 Tax=Sphingobium yanoikuyae TaxID=13690 RepID=A0A430BLH8_SPHYA|nr:EH signature domain-containing protein [Sphingobium yanoikuyae]MDG2515861.1 EH signature domain-containing protein [Sphingobium yanoikuyae]RSU52492.1 hypothetical protein DAH51_21285 [Sphingobium yanoikuyae]